ncbi:DHHA1 domain-containing protein, partial [Flavobacteriaceae bacterium]|nr:DHHA1 domain-containing protein [Flavobacteriaceae bacterium]
LNKLQKKEIELQNKIKIQSIKKDLTKNIRKINNVNFFVGEIDLDPKSIKELCFTISDQIDNLFMILLSKSTDKVFMSCFLSKNIISEKELDASNVIKELSPLINGSGGGQSFYATGGGTNVDGIDSVISEAEKIINQI